MFFFENFKIPWPLKYYFKRTLQKFSHKNTSNYHEQWQNNCDHAHSISGCRSLLKLPLRTAKHPSKKFTQLLCFAMIHYFNDSFHLHLLTRQLVTTPSFQRLLTYHDLFISSVLVWGWTSSFDFTLNHSSSSLWPFTEVNLNIFFSI